MSNAFGSSRLSLGARGKRDSVATICPSGNPRRTSKYRGQSVLARNSVLARGYAEENSLQTEYCDLTGKAPGVSSGSFFRRGPRVGGASTVGGCDRVLGGGPQLSERGLGTLAHLIRVVRAHSRRRAIRSVHSEPGRPPDRVSRTLALWPKHALSLVEGHGCSVGSASSQGLLGSAIRAERRALCA